jgi:hypothetical protein
LANLKASTYANRELAEQHHLTLVDHAIAVARHTNASQELIYRQKVEEAVAGGGELLEAEAALLDKPINELIDSVLIQHNERQQRISQMELLRIKAKKEIREAQTAAEMHRIADRLQRQLVAP